jgi:hypothetical protein
VIEYDPKSVDVTETPFDERAERTTALRDLACRKAIEQGISVGTGGVWLMLIGEQYGKLKQF